MNKSDYSMAVFMEPKFEIIEEKRGRFVRKKIVRSYFGKLRTIEPPKTDLIPEEKRLTA